MPGDPFRTEHAQTGLFSNGARSPGLPFRSVLGSVRRPAISISMKVPEGRGSVLRSIRCMLFPSTG